MKRFLFVLVLALLPSGCVRSDRPSLALGSAAPDFNLPGVDGKSHTLGDFASSRVLAIVFTCNTCPTSQLYESRIRKLDEDYRDKGVTVVAINPNKAAAMQLADLGHTDVGESLDDMKVRAGIAALGIRICPTATRNPYRRRSAWSPCPTSSYSIRRGDCSTRDGSTTTRVRTRSRCVTRGTPSMRCSRVGRFRQRTRG